MFNRWFTRKSTLDPALMQRIAAWRARPAAPTDASFGASRFVVLDCETSGLDSRCDRLLALGAVGLAGLRIALADSFDTVLRQAHASSRANIVIHGIGETAQLDGEDPSPALMRFLDFCGRSPLIAYHASFDEAFLARCIDQHLGLRLRLPWLDLAAILPALFEDRPNLPLDHWLLRFGIEVPTRHSALGDAFATAQLAQIGFHRAREQGIESFAALAKLARDARWLRH